MWASLEPEHGTLVVSTMTRVEILQVLIRLHIPGSKLPIPHVTCAEAGHGAKWSMSQ